MKRIGDFLYGNTPVDFELTGFDLILNEGEFAGARRRCDGAMFLEEVRELQIVLRPVLPALTGCRLDMTEERAIVFPQHEVVT